MLLESFWAAGWLAAALISYFVIPSFGWQAALLLTALTAFYALYLRKSLPESPAHQALTQKKHTRAGGKCLDETVYPADCDAVDRVVLRGVFLLRHVPMAAECHADERLQHDSKL